MDAIGHLTAALSNRYAIEREIGRGGMAAVYLARDVRHNRRVALKVLNPELGAVLGVERFLSEIQVTANLHHPNLLPLFDSGEADGLLFYVMPYVDGESLRAKLTREKQLPIDEVVHIATAIASALDYAHRHGVIHRDLKPENILLHEGQPVVADFGIALAVSNAGGGRITQTGLSLGTPQYMSPEQATGDRVVDGRTDVYSLGAVVYEMLTGEPPHNGTTAQAIIAEVITDRPRSIRLARETVPAHVEGAVEKALAKLPADRFHTAHEFAEAIVGKSVIIPRDIITPSSLASRRAQPFARRVLRAWYVWVPWLILAAVISAVMIRPRPTEIPTTRFPIALPSTMWLFTIGGFLEMSPTGRGFAYVGQSPSGPQIYYRAMDDARVKPIEGTENGFQPFISFDGEWLGFINEGKLKKIPLGGGSAQVVADVGNMTSAGWAWGADGRILFGQVRGGLMQVPAAGGAPIPFTQLVGNELSHRGPHFLGDGRTIAFTIWKSDADDPVIGFISPNGKVIRSSLHAGKLRDIGNGYVVFSNLQGTIFGATFDIKTLVVGTPVPLMSDVYVRQGGFAAWGASRNGSLIALLGEPAARLTLVDRSGAPQPLMPEARTFSRPRVSPDGSRIALQIASGSAANTDIWLLERASQTLTRVTFGGGNSDPLWSPDGKRLLFSGRAEISNPENDVYAQPADGNSPAERVLQRPGRQWAFGWLSDGRVVVEELLRASFTRISAFRIGDTAVTAIVRAPPNATTRLPNVSPNGRWLAYTSNESGRTEVYATAVDGPSGKWQVSTQGGDQPLWSKSGREIFYRDLNSIVAARVRTSPSFAVVGRTKLFEDVYYRSNASNWDIMPDDRHFVMLKSTEEAEQLIVVTNWGAEIERRLRAVKR